jgi:Uma2 family endonuclease
MSAIPKPRPEFVPGPIDYPESDGKPMADNTKQYRWIQTIQGNLASLYRDDPNVFVAGDLLWYPVEGFPEIRNAPDVMVAFGRPKGDRGSYLQWKEAGVAPQVVFEILSPGNSAIEMLKKLEWYAEYEVQEYYVYDPDANTLVAYRLEHDWLRPVRFAKEFVSPLLKIRFDLSGPEMAVFYPDGRRFLTFEEQEAERARERQLRLDAEKRTQDAQNKLTVAQNQVDQLRQRLQRTNELTGKLIRGEATSEDLDELKRLQSEP